MRHWLLKTEPNVYSLDDLKKGKIIKPAYPDYFAFDSTHKYFDPKSDSKNPRWFMVDVKAISEFSEPISIDALKLIPDLKNMVLLNNTRLSVQPVSDKEWKIITGLTSIDIL